MTQVITPGRPAGGPAGGRSAMLVSRTWVQAAALVVLFGFAVLGFLAYRAYTTDPPIADRVVSESGQVLFTGEDVTSGQLSLIALLVGIGALFAAFGRSQEGSTLRPHPSPAPCGRRRSGVRWGAVLAVAGLLLSGCDASDVYESGFAVNLPDPVTDQGESIDELYLGSNAAALVLR